MVARQESLGPEFDRVPEEEIYKRFAVTFPGQGIQEIGMGKDLLEDPEVREIYEKAGEILGYSLIDICLEGPEEKLNQTFYTQPAVFVLNHARYVIWERKRPENPDYFAGNSLGQLNALVAAGAMSFETGLKLVKARAEAMQFACDKHPGKLFAISIRDRDGGPDPNDKAKLDQVLDDLGSHGMYLEAINSETQIVAGCELDKLKKAYEWINGFNGVRKNELLASGVFHSVLMEEAVPYFAFAVISALANGEIKEAETPVIDNTTGEELLEPQQIGRALIRHLCEPVLWKNTMDFFRENNIDVVDLSSDKRIIANMIKRHGTLLKIAGIGALAAITIGSILKWRSRDKKEEKI